MYIYTSVLYWPLPFRECPRSRSEVGLRRGPSGTLGYETEPLSKPNGGPGGTPPVPLRCVRRLGLPSPGATVR